MARTKVEETPKRRGPGRPPKAAATQAAKPRKGPKAGGKKGCGR